MARTTDFIMRVLIIGLVAVFAASCSMTMGTDTGNGGGSDSGGAAGDGGPTAQEQYRETVQTEVAGLDASSTPEDVYSAAVTIDASRSAQGIDITTGVAIIDEEMDPGELRDLIVGVMESGLTLQDIQSAMTGVYTDPDAGITAALSLDDNIDGESDAQITGDVQWVEGIEGSALAIDAEGEYVTVPDSEAVDLLSDEASIEVWIHPTQTITWAGILHKGVEPDFSDDAYSLQYWFDQLSMLFIGPDNTYTVIVVNQPAPSLNEWHHVVVTWDQTDATIYLDGDEVTDYRYYRQGSGWVAKSELPSDWTHLPDSDGALQIGSQPTQGNPPVRFDGYIDNVKLYDRMLGPDEVSDNWNELKPN
jgi:hypothetical protein